MVAPGDAKRHQAPGHAVHFSVQLFEGQAAGPDDDVALGDELPWAPLVDGIELKMLFQDDVTGARALLVKAAEQMALSARAYHRALKVARTIADLDGAASIARVHAAEALNYRFRPPGATTAAQGVGGLVA